jgi:hypothetical protein
MRSQLVIGKNELNKHGVADVVSIQATLVRYQSDYMQKTYGFIFDKFESDFGIKLHAKEFTIMQRQTVGLNYICIVSTEMRIQGNSIVFRQNVIDFRDWNKEIFSSFQLLNLVGEDSTNISAALHALGNRHKAGV